MLFAGRRLGADEALQWGIVNDVVAAADLLPRAREIADTIANAAPLAVEAVKDGVYRTATHSIGDAYQVLRSLETYRRAIGSEDAAEGPRAFAEKAPTKMDRPMSAPLSIYSTTVVTEWIDYNQHMTEGYYGVAFADASDEFLLHVGFGAHYREVERGSFYTVETYTRFLRELKLGDVLEFEYDRSRRRRETAPPFPLDAAR